MMTTREGFTVEEVAEELGIPSAQLSQWRSKLIDQEGMELEILKKAASYFAIQK